MDFFSILTLLGGLAMFLYGMQVMGDGLEKLSGGKLEKILENLSSNRVKAVLVGAAVTAVIQSSSATTVMVVGFVNSGIMHLSQADLLWVPISVLLLLHGSSVWQELKAPISLCGF